MLRKYSATREKQKWMEEEEVWRFFWGKKTKVKCHN